MCQIVSVAVDPVSMEVFHKPGSWSHSEICLSLGLDYDRVFKPEITLAQKSIVFQDGPVALKRRLPDELVQAILSQLKMDQVKGAEAVLDLNLMFKWTADHATAVKKWTEANIGDHKSLIDYSEHTFDAGYYKTTIVKTPDTVKFHKLVDEARPQTDRDKALLREYWKRNFEKRENRVAVWK
jgi:hypothetical protein